MKVVKLKRGYRIGLSDTEMALLRYLVMHGEADFEADSGMYDSLSTAEKRVYNKQSINLQAVEDRR